MSSLVLLKPDCVEHKLVAFSLMQFEPFGIEAMLLGDMEYPLCRKHYEEHVDKPFYQGLEDFMLSGPLVALRIAGDWAAIRERAMWIRECRSDLVVNPRNLVHASDSAEAAERELNLWGL